MLQIDLKAREAEDCNSTVRATTRAVGDTVHPIVTTSSVLAVKYAGGVLMVADTLASYGRSCRYKDIPRFMAMRGFTPVSLNDRGISSNIQSTNFTNSFDLSNLNSQTSPSSGQPQTLISCSGDYSDFQELDILLKDMANKDVVHTGFPPVLQPKPYASYISRVLYNKKNKFNPWWLSVVIAGYQTPKPSVYTKSTDMSTSTYQPFLAYTDMYGTYYEEDIVATGMGRYFAITLMREKFRSDMSEQEARSLLTECMQLLFYRDCAASNRVQFAKVTEAGIDVEEPMYLDSKWDFAGYTGKTIDMGLAGTCW